MERTKLLFTVAPIVALVVAVAYLQGYWGYYKLLVFPYLSFNEILAYSAAPLFGFIVSYAGGVLVGVLNALDRPAKPTRPIRDLIDAVIGGTFCVVLVYFDQPEKWFVVPVVTMTLVANHLLESASVRDRIRSSPTVWLSGFLAATFIAGSFGWGRSEAQRLSREKVPNVEIQVEAEVLKLRFLGRLSTHYFFLDDSGNVVQYPESAVKKLVYRKGL
jgi:H+/Cl- antiporter ClcA